MNRFLKPKRLDDDQRAVIAEALRRLEIGDAEGQRIFVYALDYELTEYVNYLEKLSAQGPPEVAPQRNQSRLAMTIESLLQQLSSQLNDLSQPDLDQLYERLKAHDDYHRQYDAEYLQTLQTELARMLKACGDMSCAAVEQNPGTPVRPESEIVVMLAKAYSECFEVLPNADGAFRSLLATIGEQVDLDLAFDSDSLDALIKSSLGKK